MSASGASSGHGRVGESRPAREGHQGIWMWASGYSRAAARGASTADLEHLGKFASLAIFGGLWAAGMWVLVSFISTSGEPLIMRAAICTTAGLAAFGLILIIDRTGLYVQDAHPTSAMMITWVMLRIVLVLSFGMFSSEKLIPVVLYNELEERALLDRETSDAQRDASLQTRYHTRDLQQRLIGADTEVGKLAIERPQIPAEIRGRLDAALACRRDAQEKKAKLLLGGAREADARLAVGASLLRCQDLDRRAHADLKANRDELDFRLSLARREATLARADQAAATAAIRRQASNAQTIEAGAVTPLSSSVLWRLITHSFTAALEVIALMVVNISIETLPFVAKIFAGRTALGARLAAERAIGVADAHAELVCRRNEARMMIAGSNAVVGAVALALETPELQAAIAEFAAAQARTVAPMAIATQTLRTAMGHQRDFEGLAKKAPDLAGLAYRLWTDALRASAGVPPSAGR